MFIEETGRHLAVGSREDALRLVKMDSQFWNIISIHGSRIPKAVLTGAKATLYAVFDDVETLDVDGAKVGANTLKQIFDFADSTHPGALLVHCQMGLSRSTAICYAIIARQLQKNGVLNFMERAVDILIKLRPQANPNLLVLMRALEIILPKAQAHLQSKRVQMDPRFQRNLVQD